MLSFLHARSAAVLALVAALLLTLFGPALPASAAHPFVTISGRVTDEATGEPIRFVNVKAHHQGPTFSLGGSATTDADGRYTISSRMPSGAVRISFSTLANHLPESWADGPGVDHTLIPIDGETTVEGIDVALAPAGSISGTVQGAPGELSFFATPYVRIFSTTTGAEVGWARLHLNGQSPESYRVALLPVDTYRVEFARDLDRIIGAGQYWPNVPDSAGVGAAGAVAVGYGQQVTGIDAQLSVGGTITGRLLDSNGGGFACDVRATSVDGSLSPRWESADLDGNFTITGLSTGEYRLSTTGEYGCKLVYYSSSDSSGVTTDESSAGTVSVTQGQTSTVPIDMVVNLPTLPHTSEPTVSGRPAAGLPLTASPPTWDGNVYHSQVQWFVDDEAVPGATEETFVPSAEHTGRKVSVEYDARAGGYARSLVRSEPVVIEDTSPTAGPSGLHLDFARGHYNGYFHVAWDEPGAFAPGTPASYQVVIEDPEDPDRLLPFGPVVTGQQFAEVTNEYYDTVYDLRVVAVGPAGQWSEPSERFTVTSLGGAARPQNFTDVPKSHTFAWELEWLATTAISTGYFEGGNLWSFRPSQPVLREQMAAFLHRFADEPDASGSEAGFIDVAGNHPFYDAMRWLSSAKISTGYSTAQGRTFQPSAPVLREQMAAFLYRFATWAEGEVPAVDTSGPSPFVDVPKSHTFYREILWLSETGVTTGYDEPGGKRSFRPSQPVLREQMAAFLYRFGQKLPDRRLDLSDR